MRKNKLSPLLRPDGLVRRKRGIHYILKAFDWMGLIERRAHSVLRSRKQDQHTSQSTKELKKRVLITHFGGFGDGIMLLALADGMWWASDKYVFDLYANEDVVAAVRSSSVFHHIYTAPNYFKKTYILKIPEIVRRFRNIGKHYDYALGLRYGIDNGLWPLYMSGIADKIAGFRTSGFSFCLDYIAEWSEFQHESENYASVFRACGIDVGPLSIPRIQYTPIINPENRRYLVIHMGSKDHRRVLKNAAIQTLLDAVCSATSMPVVLTGLDTDKVLYEGVRVDMDGIVNLMGQQSFREFVDTLMNAAGVITVDTAAAHIAGSNVPVLEFFSGIVSKMEFHALGRDVSFPTVDVPCAPCYHPCAGMECMDFDVRSIATQWLNDHGFANTGDKG